jgi:hypothetical protein
MLVWPGRPRSNSIVAGVRPYKLKRGSAAELEEAIAQADVPLASTAATHLQQKALRGDLDAILNKSLRRAVGDRYVGVAELAPTCCATWATSP